MRAIILLTVVAFGGFVAGTLADQLPITNAAVAAVTTNANEGVVMNRQSYPVIPEMQDTVNSWIKGQKTNGLACGIDIVLKSEKGSPFCYVNVINTTTNNVIGYLNLPFEAMSEIQLFDSQGKPVAETVAGKRFSYWTQEQIKDQLKRIGPMTMRRKGYFRVLGLFYKPISNEFSIPQAFQVKQPGEYSFHLSVRLVKGEQDKSGQFLTTQLPEVVAKVQIRPEDIPPENLLPNNQTNPPTK